MSAKGLKIAISGKGGVGKTTLSALFCRLLAQRGIRVLAVDADPDANLGMALGFGQSELAAARTIAHDKALIKERTGADPGSSGQWFMLNPKVDDIPEKYIVARDGVKLLQMGNTSSGGSGCACPENTLLKTLLNHLVVDHQDAVVIDMEAGIEHLGRGTAQAVDAFIVVVEPGQRSIATAQTVIRMAADLGVKSVYAVANKVLDHELHTLAHALAPIELIASMPYSVEAVKADLQGLTPFDCCPDMVVEASRALDFIECMLQKNRTA